MRTYSITHKIVALSSVFAMGVVTLAVFIPAVPLWLTTPLVLLGLIGVVGFLLLISFSIRPALIAEAISYSVGLGLAYILIGVFIENYLLLYIGYGHPLGALPLMVFFDLSTIVLALYISIINKGNFQITLSKKPDLKDVLFGAAPILFVIISVCGALILNNGGTGTITTAMLFLIALYVLVIMVSRPRQGLGVYDCTFLYSPRYAFNVFTAERSYFRLGYKSGVSSFCGNV